MDDKSLLPPWQILYCCPNAPQKWSFAYEQQDPPMGHGDVWENIRRLLDTENGGFKTGTDRCTEKTHQSLTVRSQCALVSRRMSQMSTAEDS